MAGKSVKNEPAATLLNGKYELGKILGHGTFAKVFKARNLETGKSVAIKIVKKDESVMKIGGMMEQIKREISAMRNLRHPNIVELHEVMASKSKIYIAMELVKGGELFQKVAKSGRIKEDLARIYFQEMISAVDFCHSRGVYHRDLKLENLLLDENGRVKVTDFGLSAALDDRDLSRQEDLVLYTRCGTPDYVAPEVIGRKGYDGAKADLWSCGVVLYVMLAGVLPFRDSNLVALWRKVCEGDFKVPSWISANARDVIVRLLDPNPVTRVGICELKDMAWFRNAGLQKQAVIVKNGVENRFERKVESETLNAFHIISMSSGFDLSPLFEEKRRDEKEEMRFVTMKPASSVVSALEEVGKAGRFSVRKSESRVRLQGVEVGRKGKLAIEAEIFPVTSSFVVVEVKKDGGDTLEYNQFCSKELRPALKDILWMSAAEKAAAALRDTP